MKFKSPKIKVLEDQSIETVIANNENEAKRNVQTFNPKSKVLKAKWVYK